MNSISENASSESSFSIGELAREFDITTRSIRFYEEQQLLIPERNGMNRVYSARDRVRLKLILRGKRLGFTLAETRELFELYDQDKHSTAQLETMLAMIHQKRQLLQQQLEDINILLNELSEVENNCHQALDALKNKA